MRVAHVGAGAGRRTRHADLHELSERPSWRVELADERDLDGPGLLPDEPKPAFLS
jgi:hypothetical protein